MDYPIWVMPYNRLTAVKTAKDEIMYIEEYGPEGGFWIEGWRAYHYQRTSKLVKWATREGGVTIVGLKIGKSDLELVPSLSPLGISECEVNGEEVKIVFEGIGGAGVSASYSRGMAKGVSRVEVIEKGGGRRKGKAAICLPLKKLLVIGIDDTDNDVEGATYAFAHNLAIKWAKKTKSRYVSHVNVQLYPFNKYKTKNCFATVLGIIVEDDQAADKFKKGFWKDVVSGTLSPNTGVIFAMGLMTDAKFVEYCNKARTEQIDSLDETKTIIVGMGLEAKYLGTGWGLVGALASLGYLQKPDEAARLPAEY